MKLQEYKKGYDNDLDHVLEWLKVRIPELKKPCNDFWVRMGIKEYKRIKDKTL